MCVCVRASKCWKWIFLVAINPAPSHSRLASCDDDKYSPAHLKGVSVVVVCVFKLPVWCLLTHKKQKLKA